MLITINECYSDNIGDQAINIALVEELKKRGEDVFSIDFSGLMPNQLNDNTNANISHKGRYWFVPKMLKTPLIQLLWVKRTLFSLIRCAYSNKKIKAIIIGGGQIFQSNGLFPIRLFLIGMVAKFFKIDVICYSIGVSKDITPIDKILIMSLLKRSILIYTRDKFSQEQLFNWGLFSVKLAPDIVFLLNLNKFKLNKKINEANYALIGVPHIGHIKKVKHKIKEDEYFLWWYEKYMELSLSQNVYLFYNTRYDMASSIRFKKWVLKKYNSKIIIKHTQTIDELLSLIQSSSLLVSGRMHSLIFGDILNIPVEAYEFSRKIKGFVEMKKKYKSLTSLKKEVSNSLDWTCKRLNNK